MNATVNYNVTTPLELLYDEYVLGIIVYKGSNPVDYYPYDLELNDLIGMINLFATDRLNSIDDYVIVKVDNFHILVIPLSDYKSLTIIFKPNTNLDLIERYYIEIVDILSRLHSLKYTGD